MSDDALADGDLLTVFQWLSPSFPVGAFSYSHGLERAVHDGDVGDADGLAVWLAGVIEHGAGRNDVILLATAYRARNPELAQIDALARALSPSSERLLETCQQGRAFARTASAIWGLDLPELTYPVAVGAAAAARRIPVETTARLFLHAFVANLAAAAIRLVPLGQTEGQACLAGLTALINGTVDLALRQSLEDLGAVAFRADIASMTHETQYSRMFRS